MRGSTLPPVSCSTSAVNSLIVPSANGSFVLEPAGQHCHVNTMKRRSPGKSARGSSTKTFLSGASFCRQSIRSVPPVGVFSCPNRTAPSRRGGSLIHNALLHCSLLGLAPRLLLERGNFLFQHDVV